ncbi:MAG: YjgP/YjgQ family permease [Bacteroidales bacterium]|nr:YjgP/YjgQ family permease [Bacteroidales bacterium]
MIKLTTRLDRYIIRKFLGTFIYAIIIIISISIVFDFSEHLDDFLDKHAPFKAIMFDYYLNFIPYFVNLFTPLFVFIAVIFFTSKLAQQSEIIAMLSSGISFRRLMYPYFLSALIIALFTLISANLWIPYATKNKLDFEERYIRNPYHNNEINIHRQIEPGVFIYLENYAVENDIAYRFSMERFENKSLVSKIFTDYAQWDTIKHKWRLFNCYERKYLANKEMVYHHATIDTSINLKPEEFKRRVESVEAMNYFRLKEFIAQKRLEGDERIVEYEVAQLKRFINPLSIFVLTLIAVSVSSRKVRGGIGMHLGLGLALSFTYILFMQVSTYMAIGGSFPAWLGVSLPTIIFTFVAIFLYSKVRK